MRHCVTTSTIVKYLFLAVMSVLDLFCHLESKVDSRNKFKLFPLRVVLMYFGSIQWLYRVFISFFGLVTLYLREFAFEL